jgi:hypothetical protein
MTTSDLAAVESLLLKVLPDPMGFAERVLGEMAERLATAPPDNGPEIVDGAVVTEDSGVPTALADRDLLLAAALGACECWGEDAGCVECGGAGAPGWAPADPELYATYVAPAVRRTTEDESRTDHSPEEGETP